MRSFELDGPPSGAVRTGAVARRGPLLAALTVLALHVLQVWGYTTPFWGDLGRWSHEVERFASGEQPYRDFQWHFPPLGLWVEGGLARLLGTDGVSLAVITVLLATLVVIPFVAYVRSVTGRHDVPLVVVCMLFALSFAQTNAAPLPMGHYSPAVLVGAGCIGSALAMFARDLEAQRPGQQMWIGLASGLAVLAKQDFWLPAALVVAITVVRHRQLTAALTSMVIVSIGTALVVATAGAGILLPLAGGFNHAAMAGAQGFPSAERVVVDLFALSLIGGVFALLASVAFRRVLWPFLAGAALLGVLTGGLHVAMTMRTVVPPEGALLTPAQQMISEVMDSGRPMLRPAFGWLRLRVGETPLPVLLTPLLLAIVAVRWRHLPASRRVPIAALLGVAIALRARRAFEATEWFEFLFSVPVAFATVELLLAERTAEWGRLRAYVLVALAPLAAWAVHAHGRGWGTRRYWPDETQTLRGTYHWRPNEARDYRQVLAAVDAIDPSRRRPLLAFGYTGGWNYFLRRRNPYPFTQDFFFSAFPADSILAAPRPPGLILIDFPLLDHMSFASGGFSWRRWEQRRRDAPYATFDRPRFDRLREGCAPVATDSTVFRVYSCP